MGIHLPWMVLVDACVHAGADQQRALSRQACRAESNLKRRIPGHRLALTDRTAFTGPPQPPRFPCSNHDVPPDLPLPPDPRWSGLASAQPQPDTPCSGGTYHYGSVTETPQDRAQGRAHRDRHLPTRTAWSHLTNPDANDRASVTAVREWQLDVSSVKLMTQATAGCPSPRCSGLPSRT